MQRPSKKSVALSLLHVLVHYLVKY